MERSDAPSDSTASSSVDSVEHNVWNLMMELLFHVQIGGIFDIFVDEIDLARIALSCHFALDLLCDKAGTHDSALRISGRLFPQWVASEELVRAQFANLCAFSYVRKSHPQPVAQACRATSRAGDTHLFTGVDVA